MIDKIEPVITKTSHPLLYFNWLKLKPSKRYKLFLNLNTVNSRLEKNILNPNVKLVIKSNCILGEVGAQTIGSAFSMMKNMTELELIIQKKNLIGGSGLLGIIQGISSLKQLTTLNLKICQGNNIENEEIFLFSLQLKNFQALKSFSLKIFENKINKQGVIALYDNLIQIQSLLILKLKLIHAQLQTDDFIQIGNKLSTMRQLEKLSIFFNYEDDNESKAIQYLCKGLSQLSNLDILHIGLKTNDIGQDSVNCFNQTISTLTKLTNIKLRFPRIINEPRDIKNLCQNFESLSHLQTLKLTFPFNLSENNVDFNSIFNQLRFCNQITKLHINIDSPKILLLIGLLNYLKLLQSSNFTLMKNLQYQFQRDTITNEVISFDFLNSYPKYKEEMEAFLQGFQYLPTLRQLMLRFSYQTKFDSQAPLLFSQEISVFKNLKILKLFIGQINSAAMLQVAISIRKLISLQEFQIEIGQQSQVRFQIIQELIESLQFMPYLKNLSIEIEHQNQSFICENEMSFKNFCELGQLESLKMIIKQNEIDEQGSIILSNWISCLQNLQQLELEISISQNKLISKNLGKGLQQLVNLKRLTINPIDLIDILQIKQNQIPLFPNLETLQLTIYATTKEYYQVLGNFLAKLISLNYLQLVITDYYRIDLENINNLKIGFSQLNNLKELIFSIFTNDFMSQDKEILELARCFSTIKNLNILKFRRPQYFQYKIPLIIKRKCKRLVICK